MGFQMAFSVLTCSLITIVVKALLSVLEEKFVPCFGVSVPAVIVAAFSIFFRCGSRSVLAIVGRSACEEGQGHQHQRGLSQPHSFCTALKEYLCAYALNGDHYIVGKIPVGF
uniref:Putative secreted protein n=1 Tax=Ixodes ricinus TaxID=34613 RepID=A0A6B0UJK6_IXORI